jgi:hypothetical protein
MMQHNNLLLDVIHRAVFYLKQRFGDWTLSPFSTEFFQINEIYKDNPYHRIPEATQDKTYKPNTTQYIS